MAHLGGGVLVRASGEGVVLERGSTARRLVGAVAIGGAVLLWHTAPAASGIEWLLALAALAGFGTYLCLARSGFRIDLRSGTIAPWWRVGPLGRDEPKRIDGFSEVVVRREVVRTSRSSAVRFPVRLVGDHAELRLFTFTEPAFARRFGEAIARVLWKPLRTDVGGEVVVRAPEHLDQSAGERLAASGRLPGRPSRPPNSRIVADEHDGISSIRIPPLGAARSGLWLMALAVPVALAAPALALGFASSAPSGFGAGFVIVAALPLLVGGASCLVRGRAKTRIVLADDRIRIERCVLGIPRVTELDADTIEDVVVTEPGSGSLRGLVATGAVTLISDRGFYVVGRGLCRDDLHYLADLVKHALYRTAGANALVGERRQIQPGWI
jgi:hypothetical protein